MLREMAVADAYAIAFEFVKAPKVPNDLKGYYRHPRYSLSPSLYTDDTQRALANARVITRGSDIESPAAWIRSLQDTYRESPRKGYSQRFQEFLKANLDSQADTWMERIQPAHSNGGIMGIMPLAFLPPEKINKAVRVAVTITHHEDTVIWGLALAHAGRFLLDGLGAPSQVNRHLCETVPGYAEHVTEQELFPDKAVPMEARATALAAIGLVMRHDSYSEIIKAAVAIGGDTDSVAAIATGLASCSEAHEDDLPDHLLKKLEKSNAVSQQRLIDADHDLMKMLLEETAP